RLQHDFDQWLLGAGRFLRHLADAGVLRDRYRAAFRRKVTGNDAEKRRLAGSVAADKPRLCTRRKRHAGMIEEKAPGNTGRKVGNGNHGAGFGRNSRPTQYAPTTMRTGPGRMSHPHLAFAPEEMDEVEYQ